jgi:NTE family protein
VETAHALADVWRRLRREHVFPLNARVVLGGLANHRDHFVPATGVRRLIERHLEIGDLREAAIPLHLVAYDVRSGEEVRLSDGDAAEAVLAAAAIPGVLPPVRRGERVLVDGGLVNNTPISHAVELGAERIFVLPTGTAARAGTAGHRGALEAAVHAFTLLVGARLEGDLQRYADAAELVVLPAANRHRVQPTDFGHASRLIGEALSDARDVLAATSALPAAA